MFIEELIQSIIDMPGEFADVATADPLSAVLVAIGGLLTFAAMAVFGGLTLGAVVDLLTPETSGPPRRPDQ